MTSVPLHSPSLRAAFLCSETAQTKRFIFLCDIIQQPSEPIEIFYVQNILQKTVPVPYGKQISEHHYVRKCLLLFVLTQLPECQQGAIVNNKQTSFNQPLQATHNFKIDHLSSQLSLFQSEET